MTLHRFQSGHAVDPDKLNENFDEVAGGATNIVNSQISPDAAIDPRKVDNSLDGNANLYEDLVSLDARLDDLESAPVGTHSPWEAALPLEGVLDGAAGSRLTWTPHSDGSTGGYVTLASGDLLHSGYQFAPSAVRVPDGSTMLDANSVYAIRATVVDGALTLTATKLGGSARWANASISAASSGKNFQISTAGNLMGATVHFLEGALAGTYTHIPWANGAIVGLAEALPGLPTVGHRVAVCFDDSNRRGEADGSNGGNSTPKNALLAIVATLGAGQTPVVLEQPVIGGPYVPKGQGLVTETDWCSETGATATFTVTPPYKGLRVVNVRGLMAFYWGGGSPPAGISMRPFSAATIIDGDVEYVSGGYRGYVRGVGVESSFSGSTFTITMYAAGPLYAQVADPGVYFSGYRAKVIVEWGQ